MPKGKIQSIFPEKFELYKKLENDWQNFLSKDTYLIFDKKQKFLEEIKRITKFPRKIRKQIKKSKKELKNWREDVLNYNEKFIKKRLDEYSSFFDGKTDNLKYGLDEDQRIAVVKDDKHNLVVAGAGSGKTSVLSTRIAYLVRRKDKVNPNRILALAFTKVAANEMRERIKEHYGIDVDIYTFHALGRKIIQEETSKKPKLLFDQNFDKNQYKLIEQLFGEALKDSDYQNLLIKYLAYHIEQAVDEESFADKEEYYKYMENKKYSTLSDIEVKSIAERDIANFLFIHNIDFNYEQLVEWVDESDEEKEYHPDFYLPKYDIYIEHWGLNENNQVPPWFSISSKEYLELRKWKLSQFKKHQKILVETWDYEKKRNELIPNLQRKLLDINSKIKFIPLHYEDLVEKTHGFKEKRNEVVNLIVNFIKIAKSNFYNEKDIEDKLKLKKYTKKQKIFGQLALEVFKRYENHLKAEDKIDFNDMINHAVQFVKDNPEKYQNMYDHLLVDEFQDISYQRLQLIKGFVNENSDTKLFCVGDDWQSIYQFTGSDVRFFTNFDEFFANPEITYLKTNYRSSVRIVDLSNQLISKNKEQIKKIINANKALGQQPLFFELSKRFSYGFKSQIPHVYELIKKLVDEGVKPHKIMVLSRFNKFLQELEIYCGARGIPTEYKAGGVIFYTAHSAKGSQCTHVILTDITSGLYGFPCEIQDSSVMEVAKRFKIQKYIEEERRLFYVALTRSKKYLYLYSIEGNNSIFLDEIKPNLMKIHVDDLSKWELLNSEIITNILHEKEISNSLICPDCGKFLVERKGKRGKFLGCSGFPTCTYTYEFEDITKRYEDQTILTINDLPRHCIKCGSRLAVRKGKYGGFLGCTGYPKCRFTFNLSNDNPVICPSCGSPLTVRKGPYGTFLGCTNYPRCKYLLDFKSRTKWRKFYSKF